MKESRKEEGLLTYDNFLGLPAISEEFLGIHGKTEKEEDMICCSKIQNILTAS
jgi:hypothetical protein